MFSKISTTVYLLKQLLNESEGISWDYALYSFSEIVRYLEGFRRISIWNYKNNSSSNIYIYIFSDNGYTHIFSEKNGCLITYSKTLNNQYTRLILPLMIIFPVYKIMTSVFLHTWLKLRLNWRIEFLNIFISVFETLKNYFLWVRVKLLVNYPLLFYQL